MKATDAPPLEDVLLGSLLLYMGPCMCIDAFVECVVN